jgi:hypothetical protein
MIVLEESMEGIYHQPQMNEKAKPKDTNMQPVGFRTTRILTDYARPKTSRAPMSRLFHSIPSRLCILVVL